LALNVNYLKKRPVTPIFYSLMGKYAVTFDHKNIRYRHPVAFKAQIAQFAIIFST
jgi:hypothetical protein